MGRNRLEAFSDGVIAIIITIMVLELHVPHGADWHALAAIAPSFASYVLSFVYVAIYWNNHHHLLHTVTRVDGLILWANSFLLFWLSIIPAATAWMGQNLLAPVPTAIYGGVLLMPAIAYYLLQRAIIRRQGEQSVLAKALGSDLKGQVIAGTLHRRYRARLCQSVAVDGSLRVRRDPVACSRPAHRQRYRPRITTAVPAPLTQSRSLMRPISLLALAAVTSWPSFLAPYGCG